MSPLTKEQRAAKFATKKGDDIRGLRSRGHRKLSADEQRTLLGELAGQPAEARLHSLRVLREAARSSDVETALERTIYERSVQEYIRMRQFESVVHTLGHLCTLAGVAAYWQRLYVFALANAKHFHAAFQHCRHAHEYEYVRSVLNMDVPRWKLLVSRQADSTTQILMDQFRPEVEAYTRRLEASFKHPAQAKR